MEPRASLHRPSKETIQRFLRSQSQLSFTYPAVGATATTPPAGYNVDHTRIKLGAGERTFLAAKSALQSWTQFRLGWVEAFPLEPSFRVGDMVAVLGRTMGLWWLNACRVVYVVDDDGPIKRWGFAYGTTPAHAGRGEERFIVEWDRATDTVWYDIHAFSKPHGFFAHLGYAQLRNVQRRFAKDSGAAMLKAVGAAPRAPA